MPVEFKLTAVCFFVFLPEVFDGTNATVIILMNCPKNEMQIAIIKLLRLDVSTSLK